MDQLIKHLKNKITSHQEYYKNNELAVRIQLIEPILDLLGWDTKDPSIVRHNTRTEGKDIPDYTLLSNEKVLLYIEAKNLSTNILDYNCLSQLSKYCVNQGKEFGILTNGKDWILIRTFQPDSKIQDRLIWKIELDKDEIPNIISKFSLISYNQIYKLNSNINLTKSINLFWGEYINEKDKLISNLAEKITNEFLLLYPKENINFEFINDNLKKKLEVILADNFPKNTAPSAIQLNENKIKIEPNLVSKHLDIGIIDHPLFFKLWKSKS